MIVSPWLWLALLMAVNVTLASTLELWFLQWRGNRAHTQSILGILMGDSRRMFANHFFIEADVYFHSGYYPSIFDHPLNEGRPHIESHATQTVGSPSHEDEISHNFLGPPKDWIDWFGRHFIPTKHTHLDETGNTREILPWLDFSAELDPHRVETFTVTAYWLCRMGKIEEAEAFLRRGWRANPNSYKILFELGRVFADYRHDPKRARNLWNLALRKWRAQEARKSKPDLLTLEEILGGFAKLEEDQGRWGLAVDYFKKLKRISPHPEIIQKRIEALQKKMKASSPRTKTTNH